MVKKPLFLSALKLWYFWECKRAVIMQIAPYLMVHQLDVKDNLLKVLFPDYVVLQKRSSFNSFIRDRGACHQIQRFQSGDKHSK